MSLLHLPKTLWYRSLAKSVIDRYKIITVLLHQEATLRIGSCVKTKTSNAKKKLRPEDDKTANDVSETDHYDEVTMGRSGQASGKELDSIDIHDIIF